MWGWRQTNAKAVTAEMTEARTRKGISLRMEKMKIAEACGNKEANRLKEQLEVASVQLNEFDSVGMGIW